MKTNLFSADFKKERVVIALTCRQNPLLFYGSSNKELSRALGSTFPARRWLSKMGYLKHGDLWRVDEFSPVME